MNYDFASSFAAFQMAVEKKTDYATELKSPCMKAKLIATAYRKEWEATNRKLQTLVASIESEVTR